jgi:hypothetical protein
VTYVSATVIQISLASHSSSNIRKMRIFLMRFSEHAINFITIQKLIRKKYCESYAYNRSFWDEKCTLKGTENTHKSMN